MEIINKSKVHSCIAYVGTLSLMEIIISFVRYFKSPRWWSWWWNNFCCCFGWGAFEGGRKAGGCKDSPDDNNCRSFVNLWFCVSSSSFVSYYFPLSLSHGFLNFQFFIATKNLELSSPLFISSCVFLVSHALIYVVVGFVLFCLSSETKVWILGFHNLSMSKTLLHELCCGSCQIL